MARPALVETLGPAAAEPAWAEVKRWRFAVPAGRLDRELVNPPGSPIVIAGDSVTGAAFGGADHHAVVESGIWAAARVAGAVGAAR